MILKLLDEILTTIIFRSIDPNALCRVDDNAGYIWFTDQGNSYCLSIRQVDTIPEEYEQE